MSRSRKLVVKSRFSPTTKAMPDRRQRQYAHILEQQLDRQLARGVPFDEALRRAKEIAARTVNKLRAERAAGRLVCAPDRRMRRSRRKVKCRVDRGPKLVRQGGSRRLWYPGKKAAKVYACLKHGRRFKTKAALLAHLRSHGRKPLRYGLLADAIG